MKNINHVNKGKKGKPLTTIQKPEKAENLQN